MMQPLLQRASRGSASSSVVSAPAPIGGWNVRDPLSVMPPTDAIALENWFPTVTDVRIRDGAYSYATGISGNVQTLMAYNSPTVSKLFAVTSTQLFDVTAGGAVGAAVKSFSNGRFQYTHFTVPGGTYLVAVNGQDYLQQYNGSSWADINGSSTPSITGLDTRSLSNVCVHKQRLWFVQKNSMSAWYLPVTQIGGALTEFPLGQLFTRGGYLLAMATWTIDGGNGSDDYAVFLTSQGEVAVYSGIDPATDFSLVGVYYVGAPVGTKPMFRFGGDLLIITQTGLLPMSKALQSATISREVSVSNKIDAQFSTSAGLYYQNYGWEGDVFPEKNVLLVNVPTGETQTSIQYVMNTITNAWCLFTGWNAFCFEYWNGDLYFGTANGVAKAFDGGNDFGNPIQATAKTAFNYFNAPGLKHFKLFRPVLTVNGTVSINVGIDVDFDDSVPVSPITQGSPAVSLWDSASWDVDIWDSATVVLKNWMTVFNRPGYCAALRVNVTSQDSSIGWGSTDFVIQRGGIL